MLAVLIFAILFVIDVICLKIFEGIFWSLVAGLLLIEAFVLIFIVVLCLIF